MYLSSSAASKPRISPRRADHDGVPEHPSLERLAAYHREKLTVPEEEEMQEHFLSCAQCRQTFLELADFLDGISKNPRWNADDLVAAWQELQTNLRQGEGKG